MRLLHLALILALTLSGSLLPARAAAPAIKAVVETYADIAEATYADTLAAAIKLRTSIQTFLAKPGPATLDAARQAWRAARIPYMQTEAYRFGNKIVDDWEKKVNAWPLDEGLIDYVAGDYGADSPENELYAANVIANKKIKIAGRTVDTSRITKALLSKTLHEAGGIEANVATGYHAIEFLLWGQDLNGTRPGAGNRLATDYDVKACTGGHCDRRAQYLRVVTDLLIDDLTWMANQWKRAGSARALLTTGGDNAALIAIFTGLGSLSYGELAGERMKLGLMIHDPEEEHDCFSDNTHNSHYYDAIGIRNVYLGRYQRTDGSTMSGASVSDLVKDKDSAADQRVRTAMDLSIERLGDIVKRAETTEAYDQMIGEGNADGNAIVEKAIEALIAQAQEFERAVAALGLQKVQFEKSNSLDAPEKVGSGRKK